MKTVVVVLKNTAGNAGPHSAVRQNALRATEAPLAQALRTAGATHVTTGSAIPVITASVTAAQQSALAANPAVRAVFPNTKIQLGAPMSLKDMGFATSGAAARATPRSFNHNTSPPNICGTSESPEQDPEALTAINAQSAWNDGYTGAGVTVGYIAGHIPTDIPDFNRNAAYGNEGDPVVSEQNFSGDPSGDLTGDIEALLDAASIASQGNTTYDLSTYVNAAHPTPSSPCDIKITGAAPGASVVGFDVFSSDYYTTNSNFVQAIDYAVGNGIDVLNESFGSNPFPDTALDAVKMADDYAVSEGVTVVVSTGDAGITSTDGSPSTDPNVISVGASTTFRSYQQETADAAQFSNGTWLDNNISSISSGGFSQSGGNTVDLVAPGDLNWIPCDTATCNPSLGTGSLSGQATNMIDEGGTSESSPLTAAGAADVIQAYRSTHGGDTPSPAVVKQILMSTATDVDAPAEQQGAGLLNIGAAVKEAASYGGADNQGSLAIDTNQINITQNPSSTTNQDIGFTNNGSSSVTVNLSTRTLTKKVASQTGSVCLNPTNATIDCGDPTPDTFVRESGSTQVYDSVSFTVPNTGGAKSRLSFSAALPSQSTNLSVLKVALISPSGAYAAYSIPQGVANYGNVQVADPQAGTWTAILFDTRNNSAQQGEISWEADTWTYGAAGSMKPSSLSIAPGATEYSTFKAKSPADPGDTAQSIVVNGSDGTNTTIPVTVRTLARVNSTFHGVLTGGNGRGNPAVTSTYAFKVPGSTKDIDVQLNLADGNNAVNAYLQDPNGDTVASSSNYTFDDSFNVIGTNNVNLYKDNPQKGTYTLVLDWLQPVSGDSISMPFSGKVELNKVKYSDNLPTGTTKLQQGQTYYYGVEIVNNSPSPQTYFLDPRTNGTSWVSLPSISENMTDMPLPAAGADGQPVWMVPTDSYEIDTTLTGTVPVSYDWGGYVGDPELYGYNGGNNPSDSYAPEGELAPGLWYMQPSEIGPYGPDGAPAATATATDSVLMQSFDPTVETESGDLWQEYNNGDPALNDFYPLYLYPGQSDVIGVAITPSAAPGTKVHGTINLDDVFQVNFLTNQAYAGGDELASIPYSYKVIPGTS